MGVSAPCAQGGQKGVSDPLELGFKTGVDHLVGAGSQFLSLARAPSAGAVSLAPDKTFSIFQDLVLIGCGNAEKSSRKGIMCAGRR